MKDLASYQLSRKARDKGFKGESTNVWFEFLQESYKAISRDTANSLIADPEAQYWFKTLLAAPYLHDLQDWLREEHGIEPYVVPKYSRNRNKMSYRGVVIHPPMESGS